MIEIRHQLLQLHSFSLLLEHVWSVVFENSDHQNNLEKGKDDWDRK